MSERTDRILAAMRRLGVPSTSEEIAAEAHMERRAITSSIGWLITYGLVTVGKGPRQRKEYKLTFEAMKAPGKPHRGYMTPTVVLKGTVASRARLIDPQTAGRITEKTKFTRCPSCPVYSNVQLLPDEPVPSVFRALGPGRYLEE